MNAVVKDVMSTQPISVHESVSFKELTVRLRESQVSAFVVVDDDEKVIGVVSDADMLVKEAFGGGDSMRGVRTNRPPPAGAIKSSRGHPRDAIAK
jgi:CBS domain-containing protein